MTDSEEGAKFNRYRSEDPFPWIAPALLNSADIRRYADATGMICNFKESSLKGATYDVAVGDRVIWWDTKKQTKCEKDLTIDPIFTLEPNSIMFVELDTRFQIPNYMIMRFNLKITHVYKGLLLGTGPIVDPGYVGKLSIPLHNLTANSYTFRRGEKMIAMEFTKLSPNISWQKVRSDILVGTGKYKEQDIAHDRHLTDCINKAIGSGTMVKCSIPENIRKIHEKAKKTQKDFESTKKDIEGRLRSIQLIAIVSIVITIVPVLSFALLTVKNMGDAYTKAIEQSNAQVQALEEKVRMLEAGANRPAALFDEKDSGAGTIEESVKQPSGQPIGQSMAEGTRAEEASGGKQD